MIVCSFFTSEAYEKSAYRMRDSALQFHLKVDLRLMPDQGSWAKNVAMKPLFAKKMLEEHNEDILLLDTDAVFRAAPTELLGPDGGGPAFQEDVALFFAGNGLPSSGTMWFRKSRKSVLFLNAWHRTIENTPQPEDPARPPEFEALVMVTRKPRVAPIHALGPEYFWVERKMRSSYPSAKPVIEHFMVSKD